MVLYSKFMVENDIKYLFICNYMEMFCFLFSGAFASGTMAAEIGYMFDDWYKLNLMFEFLMGGSGVIVDVFV